ncbi:AraC family transcriptional regulator [Actinomadura decatromicini]|uniref:AraC family transcriptional regulator n=1 Tax=Actinomadura decatromicini TaxID=2604572 RepID=A0A5D3FRA2_9ACTN|nr:AraC family transcriptional regulator [Actinomadura decatromicini]TYK49655.1 AraC family transcriptional regulator [Actinomadura decatromicini]
MKGERSAADRVRHRYAPGASDVRLVTASFRTHHFVPHAHSEYAIAVIGRGVEAVRYRGADERVGAGGLLLLDAEVIHAGRPAVPQGWDYRVFYVPADLLAEIAGRRPTFPAATVQDPELAARLTRTHQSLEDEPGTSPLSAYEQLHHVLTLVLERHATRGRALPSETSWPAEIRRVQAYLAADIGRTPSLAELAEFAGMPRFTLLRAFRAVTTVTPHGYLLALRLRHAQQLLTAGHSVARAAADSGFYDQAHLHRHFRRTFAAAPGRFARAGRTRNDVQARPADEP